MFNNSNFIGTEQDFYLTWQVFKRTRTWLEYLKKRSYTRNILRVFLKCLNNIQEFRTKNKEKSSYQYLSVNNFRGISSVISIFIC